MPCQPNFIAQICVNFIRFEIDHDDPAKLTRTIGESVPATMQQRIGDRLMGVDEGAAFLIGGLLLRPRGQQADANQLEPNSSACIVTTLKSFGACESPVAMRASTFAVYYHPEGYSLAGKIMGRQAAGAAFVRAIAKACLPRLWCYSLSRDFAVRLAHQLSDLGATKTGVAWIPILEPARLAEPGLLYRPDVVIARDAWRRQTFGLGHAYSLCGVTHTISTHSAYEAISAMIAAPLEPWDALICSSNSARSTVQNILEDTAEQLRQRLGATRFARPQLPVIPLGVHTDDFAFGEETKATARQQLGIASEQIAVLFAGRLIFHGKAHPLPMFLALEKAARGFSVVLILAGKAPRENILQVFREEARLFCPSVRLVIVDGGDLERYRSAWAAADIFTSLSDSFQETFGLTPIEAMSAGLPSVVSDWDGYREGIRDGVDGFRIPTLTLAPGSGSDLADRYDAGIDNFDYFCGHTSQFVAVNVELAAEAYRKLISDPGLRKQMGHAAQQRARAKFDWSLIFQQYQALWQELRERRIEEGVGRQRVADRRPDRPDPFSMFESYPTSALTREIAFQRRGTISVEAAVALRTIKSTRFARNILPSIEVIEDVLARVKDDKWTTFEELVQAQLHHSTTALERALVWLTKVGVLHYRASRTRGELKDSDNSLGAMGESSTRIDPH